MKATPRAVRTACAGILAAGLYACLPTTGCGCSPGRDVAVVHGRVTGPEGSPVGGARLTAEFLEPGCTGRTERSQTVQSAATGEYRLHAAYTLTPKPGSCLRLLAEPPEGSGLAPPPPVPFAVAFRSGGALDSVRVDVVLARP